MGPRQSRSFLTIILILAICSACAPVNPAATLTPTIQQFDTELIPMNLTGASIVWPVLDSDVCASSLPAPSIEICLENTSAEAATPGDAAVALPAFLASAAFEQILGPLPGGDWLPPHPITLTGIPGVNLGSEGIIIININPAPDAAAAGIIIVNNIPASSDVSSVFIVLQKMPDPLTGEGIIIVNNKDGAQAITGAVTLDFKILSQLNPSQPMSDTGFAPGFAEVAADITQDGYEIFGSMDGMLEFSPLNDIQQMEEGIIWGGIVSNPTSEYIESSPLIMGIDFRPPPDDKKAAIVWGGMPENSKGIIIVENVPSPEEGSEGIIIIENNEINHVMGPIVIDKPNEGSTEGIVLQNMPLPNAGKTGIVWGGIIWGGLETSDETSQGIVIQNTPIGALGSLLGLPDGYGYPQGMMPLMGDFGAGPMAFGQLSFEGDEYLLPAKEQKCFEILLSGLVPYLPGAGDGSFPVDSFFDVFTDLTVDYPEGGESSRITTRIDPPAYPICTPTPGPISTMIPEFATPTATRESAQPTPTPRQGLPTVTPTPLERRNTPTP